jgi:hypothetical protein
MIFRSSTWRARKVAPSHAVCPAFGLVVPGSQYVVIAAMETAYRLQRAPSAKGRLDLIDKV